MQVKEEELISRKLKICENCEWCVPRNEFPICLLDNEQKGLFETCKCFDWRTGNHISM